MGYRYLGPGNLYQLTLIEIDNLTTGKAELRERAEGAPPGELDAFHSWAADQGHI